MAWLTAFFGRDGVQAAVAQVTPAVPFAVQATASLDRLARAAHRASNTVSPQVYSQLRTLDDVLRPLIAHVADHPVIVEHEIAIDSLITDYIPTALTLFCKLPATSQADGGTSDLSLREQYTALERSARRLSASIFGDSEDALATHAIFINTKFNE